ncbi:MAG: MATE family efflux transporter [Butyrivibrio sp.]|nr:MATE family efflux transporter [Butyrivibrio sp.]
MADEMLFDGKKIRKLILPLVVEQMLAVTVGMADMIMVSGAGETAVSGISLVNTISNLLIMFFSALATGGAVVSAQFLGAGNHKKACHAAGELLSICILTSVVITLISLILNHQILHLIYGNVEPQVMQNAVTYFYITALSFPFLAVYNACAGLFRSMNNSRVSMEVSVVMNFMNVAGNAVFVYGFHLMVAGVALSTLISRMAACMIMYLLIRRPGFEIHITERVNFHLDMETVRGILSIGIPNALENSMFNIGKLMTQSLISGFGTASIAANACASTVETMADIPSIAIGLGLVTMVGQCAGAGRYDQARFYGKKMMKTAYQLLAVTNILILAGAGFIAGWFNLSEEGNTLAIILIRYHSVCCMAIWPLAFTIPSILRAAGDAKYTMTISIVSMWIFRIGLAYVIGGYMQEYLQMGVVGVWIAMTIDWVVRAVFNIIRFRGHRWEGKAVTLQEPA